MSIFSVEYMKKNRKIGALTRTARRRRGQKQLDAARALAEIGDGEAARALLQLASDDDIAVWEPAQQALTEIRNDAAVPALCDALLTGKYELAKPVLAALTGEPVPAREDIEAKKQIILRHGLALWDTLERCTITGASDASIRDAVPNDIAALLAKAPIEAVFCNGAAAYRIYTKYLQPVSGIAAVKLPSTSPANAACRPETLRAVWGEALGPWISK